MTHDTQVSRMTDLSQLSVEQGEGKPPAIFEVYFDKNSTKKWKAEVFEKIRQFAVAIKSKRGYPVLLRREHEDVANDDELDGIDVIYVEIVGANQTYVFFVTDYSVEYIIQKEVFKHG